MKSSILDKAKTAPKNPGVYIFRAKKEVLYVGKAANLRARLKSYLKITDAKTQSLHEEATKLDYITLRSEIEALIEESRLIKELKPKYNILWRDDKSYLYVALTRQSMPKVFITHRNLKAKYSKLKTQLIGPFTDGAALRLVMKLLRRQFPYCTCFQPHLRDCLNAQIGKCFGFCCRKNVRDDRDAGNDRVEQFDQTKRSILDHRTYHKNLRAIKMILRGQSKKLLKTLSDEKEKWALEKIFEHQPYLGNSQLGLANRVTRGNKDQNTLASSGYTLNPSRLECYDNSNFAGKEAVGAMTALVKKDGVWQSDKNSYRKFKIKSSPTRDDPRMIYEVVSRRLNHPEWPYPNLIIIDGGITQLNAALKAQRDCANEEAKKIKITAYPKPQKILLGWPNAPEEILKLAERAIYQTHNFVIRYHRKVRNKNLFAIM